MFSSHLGLIRCLSLIVRVRVSNQHHIHAFTEKLGHTHTVTWYSVTVPGRHTAPAKSILIMLGEAPQGAWRQLRSSPQPLKSRKCDETYVPSLQVTSDCKRRGLKYLMTFKPL